jgi:hypothetical protein
LVPVPPSDNWFAALVRLALVAVKDDPKVPEPEQLRLPLLLVIVHPVAKLPPAKSILPLTSATISFWPVVSFLIIKADALAFIENWFSPGSVSIKVIAGAGF